MKNAQVSEASAPPMAGAIKFGLVIYVFLIYITYGLYSIGDSVEKLKMAVYLGDFQTIESYVDFENLQNSLKQQVQSEILHSLTIEGSEKINQATLTFELINGFIDLYVSSNGLVKLYEVSKSGADKKKRSEAKKIFESLRSNTFISLSDVQIKSPIRIEAKGQDKRGRIYILIFSLHYFKWVLSDVNIDFNGIEHSQIIDFLKKFGRN